MCGRYALALRPSEVRQQLQRAQMPVDSAPADGQVRQSYNFAPGYHGLVYRADGPDHGGAADKEAGATGTQEGAAGTQGGAAGTQGGAAGTQEGATGDTTAPTYKLQAMQWGLVPFWTKRNPDYASKLKTINCRDDSLSEDRGMWTTMKKKKRCIVVAQGFFEWLKKNNGKDRLPHFTRRSDGQLMCLAALWDCVQFEDSPQPLYTYSIITTDANKQLQFLHDRMPVILDNGSDAIRTWLDPARTEWSADLQDLLQPFAGPLDCYQVDKGVGKVGNNSPSFLVPIDSAANKNNIANFFAAKPKTPKQDIGHDADEMRATTDRIEGSEDNAPLPVPASTEAHVGDEAKGIKRERSDEHVQGATAPAQPSPKRSKTSTPRKQGTRSATSNGSAAKTPSRAHGSRKITSFFSNK